MLDMDEIEKEIHKLEECGDTTYGICDKLATLYIVRAHYKPESASNYTMNNMSSSMSMMKPLEK